MDISVGGLLQEVFVLFSFSLYLYRLVSLSHEESVTSETCSRQNISSADNKTVNNENNKLQ